MQQPSAIIFVNSDLNSVSISTLTNQLSITEVMTDIEFNARVAVDPNYPVIVHLNNLRILVINQSFHDFTNRNLADIVIFVKQGLLTVELDKSGPPSLTLPIDRINLFNLFADINRLTSRTFTCQKCKCGCDCNCFKHLSLVLQRMLINPFDRSHVHDANCDNLFNNQNWINRN